MCQCDTQSLVLSITLYKSITIKTYSAMTCSDVIVTQNQASKGKEGGTLQKGGKEDKRDAKMHLTKRATKGKE